MTEESNRMLDSLYREIGYRPEEGDASEKKLQGLVGGILGLMLSIVRDEELKSALDGFPQTLDSLCDAFVVAFNHLNKGNLTDEDIDRAAAIADELMEEF